MEISLLLVLLAVGVLSVTAVAERGGVPAPLALIVVGVAFSFVPGTPDFELEADVVLFGLLPPLLYAAAISTSLVDFNANRRSILLLSVGLVVFTTVGVAALLRVIIPDLGWPAALAIGAVVAPPDAVAATAIGRRIGLPRRIVTILEGESLFNDATALVALRTAIAAAGTGITAWEIGLDFVLAAGGGLAIGVLGFVVISQLRRRVTDPLLDTAISFVVPFAAYVAAEEVHGSGVVAVVVVGLLLGHKAAILQTAQSRIAERMNWRSIAYALENAVFLLIGLQAERLFGDLAESELGAGTIVTASLATLVAVIVLRLLWVFPARYLLVRPGSGAATGRPPGWQNTFLLGWAGMRGVVTLAAAFVIPPGTEHLEVLRVIAFTVVAGTLLIQGASLPWLARRLDVAAPDPVDDALARATLLQQASKAGFKRLRELEYDDPHGVIASIKHRVEQRNFAAWERLGTVVGEESPSELYSRVRTEMIDAERRRVLEVRSSGQVPSEVVADVLAMLDVEESMLDFADEERANVRDARSRAPRTECEHLVDHPLSEPEAPYDDLVCEPCLVDGTRPVALRMCLDCGFVGCCDSSPGRHATVHFRETTHPVMRSVEPDEDWRWCFLHHTTA